MLTREQAAVAKGLLARGEKQHDVAAFLGCNGGRIAEIATGRRFADVSPAPRRELPSPGLMTSGYAAFIALQALDIIEVAYRSARDRILALHPDLQKARPQ